ncbi:hypothetical protein [Nannocystis sp. SCPEA4]|uniref:hypothetical protein n=1 Tax=Nannocystis sp. SCPEA4 TaxID=2996787 RepID=UPI0022722777|nr:hypothetical protein [Nannocystis sp. SCPEA4]MCY1061878.1 hypothetical protein [Nannocystis sp. SCPEA4]
MTALRRHRPLLAGLVAGLLVAVVLTWLLDPARWLRPGLGHVFVIGTCSYSKVALDILRADPQAPFVPLVLPADAPEFEADACDVARARLRQGGAFWLGVLPRDYVCRRLRDLAAARFASETTGEGYPAWVGAGGEFAGLGVDPRQIAELGLTPPPPVVRFWIEGGYDRALVESLGFTVPEGTVQGPRDPSPMASAPQ